MIKELTRPLLILVLSRCVIMAKGKRHLSMTIPFVNYPTTSQRGASYNLRKSYLDFENWETTEDFEHSLRCFQSQTEFVCEITYRNL